jgi:DNA-binding transcriptional LysR family regulator
MVDLMAEDYDLAIRTGRISDHRLIATQVAAHTLYTCAGPSYLAHAGKLVKIADLQKP